MKTKEELNAIKKEVEALNKKLAELTEEELKEVTGGSGTAQIGLGVAVTSIDTNFSDKKGEMKCAINSVLDSFTE